MPTPPPTPHLATPWPKLREVVAAVLERPSAAPLGPKLRAWSRSWRGAGLALFILCLAVYLPGLWSIPPVDRDESRFAQASRTMLESGDWIVPRIQDTPRLNKPPLIYWLQASSAWLLGDAPGADGMGQWGNGNIWVFRVPSVLAAIGSVLVTWRAGLRLFDPRAAALGAALLAVCPMVVWDAHQARADQLLLFATTGAMWAMAECWLRFRRGDGPGWRWPLTLWIFVGIGVLAKGPVTPMIVVLTALTLAIASRRACWLLRLRPILGLIIVAACIGPWVYLVAQRVGWQTYSTTVWNETLGRAGEAAEGHWGPPGYHLVLLPVLFWPGSLTTAAAIKRAWQRGLRGFQARRAPEAFLLAWILPAWLVFECIATKLPHYTMPLYPAIALLSARRVFVTRPPAARKFGVTLWAVIGAVLFVAGPASIAVGGFDGGAPGDFIPRATRWALLGVLAVGACMLAGVTDGWKGKSLSTVTLGTACLVLSVAIALGVVLPRASFWLSPPVATEIHMLGRNSPVALVDYGEDSLLFLLRPRDRDVQRVALNDLGTWITAHPSGIVVAGAGHSRAATMISLSHGWQRVLSSRGFNYSVGKDDIVDVFVAPY